MAFNKQEYWANRKAGWRGQGESPKAHHTTKNGYGVLVHNRWLHRLKEHVVDRIFNRKGYAFGKKKAL